MTPADPMKRLVGYIIDMVILNILYFVVALVSTSLAYLVFLIAFFGYFVYFWSMKDGVTIGHGLVKLRVVKVDGSAITTQDALLRAVVYLIPILFLLYFVNKEFLHDKVAGTTVVSTE